MKKFTLFPFILLFLALTACGRIAPGQKNTAVDYTDFLQSLYENSTPEQYLEYCLKDLDNDGVEELIIKEQLTVTIYTFKDQVKEIGTHEFQSETLRLFYSDNLAYPGILSFCAGTDGVDYYDYLSIQDDSLVCENLWENRYIPWTHVPDSGRMVNLSSDEQLIEESRMAYNENKDLELLSITDTFRNNLSSESEHEYAAADYTDFLHSLYENSTPGQELYYCLRDMDNNGVEELIVKEVLAITIYTFKDGVTKIDSYDFMTGSLRLLYSDNPAYPGIIYFTVGGGVDHYNYLSIKNDSFVFEKLWEERYAFVEEGDPHRIVNLSSDVQLIEESRTAYNKNKELVFLPLESISDNF